ncbi:MAG: cation diffusion facilitator family transporter [Proteobacteria bacterium]|nr:cation diffusion facilitator family transporter [Pseudomonadota bacterium]
MALNVLLAAFHGIIANASGSLAVAAELVHNVVDLLTAVAVLIGLRLATRKSEAFPYGLYKVENLTAAGLAAMIFVSAYEIVREALLAPPAPIHAEPWMFGFLLITTAIPLFFSHFEMRAAREANSPALLADAKEYRVHVFTTGLAFVALFSQWLHLPLDRIAALLIVVAVVKTGWDVLRDSMRVLLDASLDAETLQRIRQVIDATPAVSELRWVTGRNAGRFRFVEAGVTLRVAQLGKVEEVLGRIEAAVRAAVPHVERVLLHVESPEVTHLRYAIPLADREGAVSAHFGESPYFALVTVRRADHGVEEQRIISNPHQTEEKAKGHPSRRMAGIVEDRRGSSAGGRARQGARVCPARRRGNDVPYRQAHLGRGAFLTAALKGTLNRSARSETPLPLPLLPEVALMSGSMGKEQIFELIINNLPLGFSIVDQAGAIVEFNQIAEEITGFSREEVLGKYHFAILHGTADAAACPLLQRTLKRQEQSVATESVIQKKNGDFISISVTTFPLFDHAGNFIGGVELFRDITEFKKLSKERANILSMFAHDMKNPVMTSGGLLSRILSGKTGVLSDKQKNYLEMVQGNLGKLEKLIADFLEFSRLETKEYLPALEAYDIGLAMKNLIDMAWLEAEKKGIKLVYEAPVDVPVVIQADAMMMDRVISNLLMNALKYTKPDGCVKITLSDSEKDILVQVSDTGVGIPEMHLPHIFDSFYRVNRDTSGSGLGLSIAKVIIEAHQGRIWAESIVGKGSTFSFILSKREKRDE